MSKLDFNYLLEQKTQLIDQFMYYDCAYFNALHIEICSYCNLKCSHCPRTILNYDSKNRFMDFAVFKNIINSVSKNGVNLHIQGLGEPTMHPQFLDFIEYSSFCPNISNIAITSNCLYKNSNDYNLYFDKGLTQLVISLDSLHQDKVNILRAGTNAGKLLDNISAISAKHSHKLAINTIINRINYHELDNIAAFLINNNIRRWSIEHELIVSNDASSTKHNYLNFDSNNKQSLNLAELKDLSVIINAKYSKYFDLTTNFYTHPTKKNRCTMPWDILHISARGYIVPCCMYFIDSYMNFGSITDIDINEIWLNDHFQHFRNTMYNSKPCICTKCPLY